jgi:translocation and assembly module TamA
MKFPGRINSTPVLLLASLCAGFLLEPSGASRACAEGFLDVRVEPANPALKANIEGYIGSVADRDEPALQRTRRGAEELAKKAAQALGFYHAQIDSSVQAGANPRLRLSVVAGEPVRLRNVTLRVEGDLARLEGFRLPDAKALRMGQALNHGLYEDAKRLILNQASRYGFFSGHFTAQRLSIDPATNQADIDLVYVSGPRYTLGPVRFTGNTPFDDDLLRRMVPFETHAPYDSALIAQLNQALQSSGYFEAVRVDAAPTSADASKVIPVQVLLDRRRAPLESQLDPPLGQLGRRQLRRRRRTGGASAEYRPVVRHAAGPPADRQAALGGRLSVRRTDQHRYPQQAADLRPRMA